MRPCHARPIVPSIDREAGAAAAMEMLDWVLDHRCDEVPGIGIDYQEAAGPPEMFVEVYAAARRAGLKTTAHAGEFGLPARNVRVAIDDLRVDRGLVFTVVPTNSYYLRTLPRERWARDHPIRRMRALGLKVHPNTDDPTLHHITPTGAWSMMARNFGDTLDDLRASLEAGLDAAWIDDATRRAWRAEWTASFDALRAEHVGGVGEGDDIDGS